MTMPPLTGDIVNGGITETVKGADNLQWEVAKKLNFGIDAKFFHDKVLSVTVDFFSAIHVITSSRIV